MKLFAGPPSSRRNASRDTLERSTASDSKDERRLRVPGARADGEAGKNGQGRVCAASSMNSINRIDSINRINRINPASNSPCPPHLRVPQHVRNRQLERKRAAEGRVDGAGERVDGAGERAAAPTAGGLGRREGCTRGDAAAPPSVGEGTSAGRDTIPGADAHAAHCIAGSGSQSGLLEANATCGGSSLPRSPPRKLSEAEELGVCAVCLNDGADPGNLIILCDSCGIAVHQVRESLLEHTAWRE